MQIAFAVGQMTSNKTISASRRHNETSDETGEDHLESRERQQETHSPLGKALLTLFRVTSIFSLQFLAFPVQAFAIEMKQ